MKQALADLDAVSAEQMQMNKQNFWYNNLSRAQLLSSAQTLIAMPSKKKSRTQNVNWISGPRSNSPERRRRAHERRFDPAVDQAVWQKMISMYLEQPEENRVAAFDKAVGIDSDTDGKTLQKKLKAFYDKTSLTNTEERLKWLTASRADFENSNDPFIKLAVALFDTEMAIEDKSKTLSGKAAASP